MKKVFFFLVLGLFSCKDENKSFNTSLETEKDNINNGLIIKMNVLVEESDKFEVFFSEKIFNQYLPDDKVSCIVEGSKKPQDIIFRLPNRIYPIKLRVDVGSKNFETPIKINSITLSSGINKKEYADEDLVSTFKPNKCLIKTAEATYLRKKINGVYDPFLVSININKEVNNLFKQ